MPVFSHNCTFVIPLMFLFVTSLGPLSFSCINMLHFFLLWKYPKIYPFKNE